MNNSVCPVNLFEQEKPRHLVRQSHSRKRKHQPSPFSHCVRQTGVPSQYKAHLTRTVHTMFLEQLRKANRIDLLAPLIERNYKLIPRNSLQNIAAFLLNHSSRVGTCVGPVAKLTHLYRSKFTDPLQVLIHQLLDLRLPGLADPDEPHLHDSQPLLQDERETIN